jgi:CRISPR/Cas system Type II protein with McrA/HNH and RuvC-like nuclease domain
MERQAYFEFVSNTTDKLSKQKQQKYANTSRDTQLNQNSATVSHVNRDNFKLNAVYDVIDTVNTLKITTKTNFYTADSDEFTGSTIGSDGLLRNKQERLFTTNSDKGALAFCLNINLLNPQNIIYKQQLNTLNTNANNFLKSANESYEGGLLPLEMK